MMSWCSCVDGDSGGEVTVITTEVFNFGEEWIAVTTKAVVGW